jgi:hypothetical protein
MTASIGYSTLYLDASGDPGWPKPFGNSRTEWYIVSGLVLSPANDFIAKETSDKILKKYIRENERRKFPPKFYEINYHDIIRGKNLYGSLEDIRRKTLSDEIFDLLKSLKPILFATASNKTQLKRVYGSQAYHPRVLGLRATIHRYAMYLERINEIGSIVVDQEEYRKDKELQAMVQDFRRDGITIRGDNYQPMVENKLRRILNTISFTPSHLSIGLQLADVCSRVTWFHFERNKSMRFNQISSLWDRESEKIYEPSIIPSKSRWI